MRYLLTQSPFKTKMEILNLALPIIFIIFSFAEIMTNATLNQTQTFGFNFLADFIFLNSVHVLFSILFFLQNSEFQNYVKNKSMDLGYPVYYLWLLFFFGIGCLATYVFYNIHSGYQRDSLVGYVLIIISLLRVHHSISQNVGISLLHYTKDNLFFESKAKFVIILERIFLPFLVFSTLMSHLAGLALNRNLQITINSIYFSIVIFIIGLIFFHSSLKINKNFAIIKMVFNLRYLLYPLSVNSRLAFFGIAATHGIEYYLIYQHVQKKSIIAEIKNFKPIFLCICGIFFITNYSNLFYTILHQPYKETYFIYFAACFVVANSISLTHFFIDGFIFKFKDRFVLEEIGPLFFKKH